MHTSALEEAELTDTEQEPQGELSEPAPAPETEAVRPETQESETTALVPREPEVIEGVVLEIELPETPKDHTLPQQKPYWLCIPFTIFCCLVFVALSLLVPLLTPTATITIIPVERTISTTEAIKVQGRQLPPLTLTQSLTTLATGHRHQDATRAAGTITFYNGLFTSQTIAQGTIFTGADGVQVITDQPTSIPAGNPPSYGQVTISAHAVSEGSQGNIPAYDVNMACCATSVLAKNTTAFQGGVAARDFIVVTQHDISSAAGAITASLEKSERAALEAQVNAGEGVITPPCRKQVNSDHQVGDEATEVTVTVFETCTGIVYLANAIDANATQLLTSDATRKLGANYTPLGDIQITIIHATIINTHQGRANVVVQVTGTWVYQITNDIQHHLLRLIAGMKTQQAVTTLLQVPGIAGADITSNGNATTLPADPGRIIIVVVYQSA